MCVCVCVCVHSFCLQLTDGIIPPFVSVVGVRYTNSFKTHRMFTTTNTCVGRGGGSGDRREKRDAKWWAKQGGPGHFVKALDEVTAEALEIRLMTGDDSFYENVAIAEVNLEVCVCKVEAWNSPTKDPTSVNFVREMKSVTHPVLHTVLYCMVMII